MLTKDEGRKMKTKMNSSAGRKFQRTLRKLVTHSLNLHNDLQVPPMTVQTRTRTLNPTNLLKFPLAPVDELLPKLWLLNQRIGTITLI